MLEGFTKYETARILGARALQISMNAPLLIKINKEDLEKVNYDAIKIAEIELNSEILPISIKRPFPEKRDERLKRIRGPQISETGVKTKESQEESEISENGEIMELATPVDELDEAEEANDSESE